MGAGMRRNSSIFQSTLPQGERPVAQMIQQELTKFQSTLPQGERPDVPLRPTVPTVISIHAPARGAT